MLTLYTHKRVVANAKKQSMYRDDYWMLEELESLEKQQTRK